MSARPNTDVDEALEGVQDRIQARFASTDPAVTEPLVPFAGEPPPAPAWFNEALAQAPERTFTLVHGARIETLAWGRRGDPGVLLLHGNGAHADWWSFIAPWLAQGRRVAAISWSGMGRSDWRDAYSIDGYLEEAFACAQAAGLEQAAEKPVWIAHSFGGAMAHRAASSRGERLKGVIVVDSPVRPPSSQWRGPPLRSGAHRTHPTLAAMLARFRLMPPQTSEHLFLLDYIARAAVIDEKAAEGGGAWRWRHDPEMWAKMDRTDPMESGAEVSAARCPLAVVWGERSCLIPPEVLAYMRRTYPARTPFIPIPDADHHVLLDQPLALVAALRALLETWPH